MGISRVLRRCAVGLLLLTLAACESSQPPQNPAAKTACPESGTPCDREGDSCGADEARKASTFSWVTRCQGGKWTRIEVPPPPPSSPPPS